MGLMQAETKYLTTQPERHKENLISKLRLSAAPRPTYVIVILLLATVLLEARQLNQDHGPHPEWLLVPAGEFWMGRTRLWLMDEIGWQLRDRADDRPVHRVALKAFAIDAHEVTNAEYASMAAAAKVPVPYHWGGPRPQPGKEQHPVYNVSWFDASKFCAAQGKRLPTEAEWEKAARGGVADTDYPWGDEYLGESRRHRKRQTRTPRAQQFEYGTRRGRLLRAEWLRRPRHVRQSVGVGVGLVRPLLLLDERRGESAGTGRGPLQSAFAAAAGRTARRAMARCTTATSLHLRPHSRRSVFVAPSRSDYDSLYGPQRHRGTE